MPKDVRAVDQFARLALEDHAVFEGSLHLVIDVPEGLGRNETGLRGREILNRRMVGGRERAEAGQQKEQESGVELRGDHGVMLGRLS